MFAQHRPPCIFSSATGSHFIIRAAVSGPFTLKTIALYDLFTWNVSREILIYYTMTNITNTEFLVRVSSLIWTEHCFWAKKNLFKINIYLWNVFHFDKWEFLINSQEMHFVKEVLVNSVWEYSSIIYLVVFIFQIFLSEVALWYTLSLWKKQYSSSRPGHKCEDGKKRYNALW